MVLVDTSIWVEASRRDGDPTAKLGLEGLLEEYEAALCGPVRLEFLGGARKPERQWLSSRLDCLPLIEVTAADWETAVAHSWTLRDQGETVPWNDILIATIALRVGMRVYARDRHFEAAGRILGLRLYEPGYCGRFNPKN